MLTEIYTESEEPLQVDEEEVEYSEEEAELLERCEAYPGLVDLAEERIALARQLNKLEQTTTDPELAQLERELERIDVETEKAHEKMDPAAVETLLGLARRVARLDRSKHSRTAKQVEAAMANVQDHVAPSGVVELIAMLSVKRKQWTARLKRERDKVPVQIEEQMDEIRARIEEIDNQLEQEFEKEEDSQQRAD